MSTPTLPDDRIEKMRMSVMHRVDQDVARRGRRARTAIGLTAASVLVVGLGGYTITSIDGGTESAGISADSGSTVEQPSAADQPATELDSGAERKEALGYGNLSGAEDDAPDADRDIITTGSVSVTVTEPRASAQEIAAWIESIGGRVDDRTERGAGDDASAYLTVRVPSAQVSATIDRLGTYGTVDDVSVQKNDVTAQTTDLDARIDALQLSIGRLEAILSGAGSSSEVIKAEDALTQRQEQLESLQAQRQLLADQVSLSTLSIELTQEAQARSVEPGGFSGGLRDGWNGLVATVNAVVQVAGVLLPWAVIVAVVVGVAAVVRRRRSWN